MFLAKLTDRLLFQVKKVERAYYLRDYQAQYRRSSWRSRNPLEPGGGLLEFPVSINRSLLKHILVYKPDEIGDCIYALPAVAQLRKAFPDAKLYLICQTTTAPLFAATQIFDEIVPVKVKLRFRRFPKFDLKSALRTLGVGRFDLTIYLRTYPAFFSQFLNIPSRYQWHPRDPRLNSKSIDKADVNAWGPEQSHQTLQMLQIVAPLVGRDFGTADVVFPKFHFTDADRALPINPDQPMLVIHPFAKDETRRYPREYWAVVLTQLRSQFTGKLVVVGGPEDTPLDGLGDVVNLMGKLTLTQTAFLLTRAKGFIGVSSGPAHLAAALGTPTIVLSGGVSHPREWGPVGESLLLRVPVPCAPCHSRTCLGYQLACLKELTPERVVPELVRYLISKSVITAKSEPRG